MSRAKHIDVIRDYLEGEIEEVALSYEQEEYLRKLKATYAMLIDLRGRKYIYKALEEEFLLSRQQCVKLIKDAEILFGDLNKVNRDMLQHIAVEAAKKNLRIALKSKKSPDISRAIQALVKAGGLDRDKAEVPDLEKLQPSLVLTVLAPEVEQSALALLSQGAINLNRIPADAEIISYESVEEQEGGEPGSTSD